MDRKKSVTQLGEQGDVDRADLPAFRRAEDEILIVLVGDLLEALRVMLAGVGLVLGVVQKLGDIQAVGLEERQELRRNDREALRGAPEVTQRQGAEHLVALLCQEPESVRQSFGGHGWLISREKATRTGWPLL